MNIAKWLIIGGLCLILLGLIIWLFMRAGVPLGKLPGDVRVEGEKVRFFFPVVTSLLLSIILTVVINLVIWFFRK